eukprot:8997039-Pyramimonas_sp.AAC.3
MTSSQAHNKTSYLKNSIGLPPYGPCVKETPVLPQSWPQTRRKMQSSDENSFAQSKGEETRFQQRGTRCYRPGVRAPQSIKVTQ